jgi:hypothetical protein
MRVPAGLTITYSLNEAQRVSSERLAQAHLQAAKVKADDDKRLQEAQLTAQFVQHLISKDATEREISIVALRASIPLKNVPTC